MFVDRLEALAPMHPEWGTMHFQTDYQLQVEHALDLHGHGRVLFVDASSSGPAPFSLRALSPTRDASFTTHAMTPQAVMYAYCGLEEQAPPPGWLLAIRGERFELGEELSTAGDQNLRAALRWVENWLVSG